MNQDSLNVLSLIKLYTGFFLIIGPWLPFSWNIYFRNLVILNSFSHSEVQIFNNPGISLKRAHEPSLWRVIKKDSLPITHLRVGERPNVKKRPLANTEVPSHQPASPALSRAFHQLILEFKDSPPLCFDVAELNFSPLFL